MFIVLLLGAIFLSKTTGLPGSGQLRSMDPSIVLLEDSQSQCVCPSTRSVLNIIWSCLSTIFLCTWVAVHPNMPGKGEHAIMSFLRRVKMMFCALIAPEMVLMFSARQWIAARDISKEYKSHGWTKTHGFFLIMGGFVLRKGEEDLGIVSPDLFRQLVEAGDIEFPSVTREEIEDKSKGDLLSKGLVILQTLWFTIQCIARGVQDLALTELEVATLAFCSLNAAMYFMWWYKPLDVQCTIPVFVRPGSDYVHKFKLKRAEEIDDAECASRDVAHALEVEVTEEPSVIEGDSNPPFVHMWRRLRRPLRNISNKVNRTVGDYVFRIKNRWQKNGILVGLLTWIVFILMCLILVPILFASRMLFRLMEPDLDDDDNTQILPGSTRVPSYYSPLLDDKKSTLVFVMFGVSGAVFGGLHLIAWNFDFPTRTETIIWRCTSLPIAIMPPIFLLSGIIGAELLEDRIAAGLPRREGIMGIVSKGLYCFYYIVHYTMVGLVAASMFLYFPARMVLLFEAFFLLRQQPSSALLDLDWQNFIPHL